MFLQLKRLNNESGVVLFIVLMTAIIIMIFSVGILTQSMNEINYAQQQIDQISCDQCAKGLFWNSYATGMSDAQNAQCGSSVRSYYVTTTPGTISSGVTSYSMVCNFDTPQ